MNTIFIPRGSHRASDDALTLRGRAGRPATASRPKGSPLKATAIAASHRRFNNQLLEKHAAFGRPGGYGGVLNTRSHSEHGREIPQRQWYFVLRHGRVGRCQVCQMQQNIFS